MKINIDLSFKHVSQKELSVFTSNLAIMLRSGVVITEAIEILADQAGGKLKSIIYDLGKSIVAGSTLSLACAKHPEIFTGVYISMVKAGEASGNLERNLTELSVQMVKEREALFKVKSAMVYPAVILVLCLILGLGVAFYILPKITPIFIGLKIDLPLSTRLLIHTSNLIKNYGYAIVAGLALIIIFTPRLLKLKAVRPVLHFALLKLPVVKIVIQKYNLVKFSRGMGALLKSGLTIDDSLKITGDTVGNYWYKKKIGLIRQKVRDGGRLASSMGEYPDFFPKMAASLIQVGESSGSLEEEFENLSKIYESELDGAVKMLTTLAEPLLLMFIGVLVGGLVLSILTPIYQVTGNITK